jgi:hypothetical protein
LLGGVRAAEALARSLATMQQTADHATKAGTERLGLALKEALGPKRNEARERQAGNDRVGNTNS